MMFVVVCCGQESDAEIAFIAAHAPEWGYEKDSVKEVLQESSSSGFVVLGAGAVWTNGGLIKVKHGYSSRCELGDQYCTPNSELAKKPPPRPRQVGGGGTRDGHEGEETAEPIPQRLKPRCIDRVYVGAKAPTPKKQELPHGKRGLAY